MLAYAVRRMFVSVPILVLATFVVFVMVSLSGDPLAYLKTRNPPPRRAPSNSRRSGCTLMSRC